MLTCTCGKLITKQERMWIQMSGLCMNCYRKSLKKMPERKKISRTVETVNINVQPS